MAANSLEGEKISSPRGTKRDGIAILDLFHQHHPNNRKTAALFPLWFLSYLNTFQIPGRLILSPSEALSLLQAVKVSQEVSVKTK